MGRVLTNMLFKLRATYEKYIAVGTVNKPVRIELLQSIEGGKYRVRIWMQNTYNLYPTFMNTDESGNDIKKIHSSDDLNQEITTLVLDDESLAEVTNMGSETELLALIEDKLTVFENIFLGDK